MLKLNQNITIVTLQSFDKNDKEEILRLIDAKYFKLDNKNIFFFKQLLKLNLGKIDLNTLLKQLSHNKDYSWSSPLIRESLSKLNTLCKDFIYLKQSRQNKFNQTLVLSDYYTKHNIAQHLPTLNNYLIKQKESTSFVANCEAYLLYQKLVVADKKSRGRKLSDNFNKAHFHLNTAYWLEMLKLECEIQNRRDKVKLFDTPSLLSGNEKVLEFIKKYLWGNQLIRLYFLLYKLNTDDDFFRIYKEWESSLSSIENEDIKSVSIYLTNYCINKIALGQNEFIQTYLAIIQILIDCSLLLEEGVMIDSTYNNIISIALKTSDFEFINFFVETNSIFLEDGEKSNTYKLCKAKVLFVERKYETAYDHLANLCLLNDYHFNISANILLIKCAVELKMDQIALSKIGNLELSINRAKDSLTKSIFSEQCLKFLDLLKSIIKEKHFEHDFNQEKIIEELWLLAIIEKRK
jgi:hypothetical protein